MTRIENFFSGILRILLCTLFLISGCTTSAKNGTKQNITNLNDRTVLKVGVSANAPPMAYKAGSKLQGLEIDFAQQLGEFLNREVVFVQLPWDKQIPALEEGKIDIIMSGMTVTPKRTYRVAFAKPYMRSGQILLVRMKEAGRYSSGIYSLMGNKPAIGTIRDTTGDFFITKTINRANITRYKTSQKAIAALIAGKIDVFVHDAPIICHFAAINEGEKLTPILKMATEEYLAWAVNKTDVTLLQKVNEFIAASSKNNNLQTTLKRWVPYL